MKRTALAIALMSSVASLAVHAAEPQPLITLPVRVHLLQSATQTNLHTTLTEADVKRIFGKVNMIWSPAGIQFEIESIGKTDALALPAKNDASRQYERIRDTVPKDRQSALAIDVAYIKSIADNGFYYGEPAIVKDTAKLTDVPGGIDEPIPRVTAHELGHSLGLKHRQNVTNLMASKMSGYSLNVEEIETARTKAKAWQAKFAAEKKGGR